MSIMKITFQGSPDEYEIDWNQDSGVMIFHDIQTHTIFMGRGESAINMDNDIEYVGGQPVMTRRGPVAVEVSLHPYSIFKYNEGFHKDRFQIFWNERQTVIWDTKEKQQVADKDIAKYLADLEKDKTNDYDDECDDWW